MSVKRQVRFCRHFGRRMNMIAAPPGTAATMTGKSLPCRVTVQSSDDADGGSKHGVTEPVAIRGQARDRHIRREDVGRDGPTPPEVALERRRKGKCVGRVARRKRY